VNQSSTSSIYQTQQQEYQTLEEPRSYSPLPESGLKEKFASGTKLQLEVALPKPKVQVEDSFDDVNDDELDNEPDEPYLEIEVSKNSIKLSSPKFYSQNKGTLPNTILPMRDSKQIISPINKTSHSFTVGKSALVHEEEAEESLNENTSQPVNLQEYDSWKLVNGEESMDETTPKLTNEKPEFLSTKKLGVPTNINSNATVQNTAQTSKENTNNLSFGFTQSSSMTKSTVDLSPTKQTITTISPTKPTNNRSIIVRINEEFTVNYEEDDDGVM